MSESVEPVVEDTKISAEDEIAIRAAELLNVHSYGPDDEYGRVVARLQAALDRRQRETVYWRPDLRFTCESCGEGFRVSSGAAAAAQEPVELHFRSCSECARGERIPGEKLVECAFTLNGQPVALATIFVDLNVAPDDANRIAALRVGETAVMSGAQSIRREARCNQSCPRSIRSRKRSYSWISPRLGCKRTTAS